MTTERTTVAGRHGEIPIEIYRPARGRLPLVVWFHGGGANAGGIETHRIPLAQRAVATGWAIASVGYRLAPEHRFPVQHEDCLDALQALATDAPRLVVVGDSIRGLFATTVARLVRDGGLIEAQILLYPNTDLRQDRAFASLVENDGRVMTRASLAYEADNYIPSVAARHARAARLVLTAPMGYRARIVRTGAPRWTADHGPRWTTSRRLGVPNPPSSRKGYDVDYA